MTLPVDPRHTRQSLGDDLRRLGVRAGDTLLVQSSLRQVGPVTGGAPEVVAALLEVLGPDGTLVVPTYTAGNSDPSRWALTRGQAVDPDRYAALREQLPAFDPALTPSEGMGAVAETVRTWPGAQRSAHPQTSFAAVGRDAARITAGHPRDCHLGPDSPLGRLAGASARVLLLGVPIGRCTAFHLAEYLVPDPPTREYECVVTQDGRRAWFRYRDVVLDDSDFPPLAAALEGADGGPDVVRGPVGDADCQLLPLAESVEFARAWMARHRGR